MLKTKKHTKKKWLLVVSTLIIILVTLAGVFYIRRTNHTPQPSNQAHDNHSAQGQPEGENGTTQKQQQDDKQRVAATDPNIDSSKPTDKIPVSPTMSANITLLEHKNATVSYSFKITNAGPTGTCSAEFTNPEGKPVTRSSQTTSDTCGTTTIPDIEFDAYGKWHATFRYYSGNQQAVTSGDVEIKR